MTSNSDMRKRLVLWGVIFGALTALGLLDGFAVIGNRLSTAQPAAWGPSLVTELTGAYAMLPLMPFLLWMARRFPIGRQNWPLRLPLHLAASMAFGVVHTLLMWGSRTLLWPALGWGAYDYGDLWFRFPMEYTKQLMAYIVVYGCVVGFNSMVRRREQEKRAEELERQVMEARLAALKMQLNPHFLFNTLNMISSYIHEAPETADTMIAHLSDFLRLTLKDTQAQEVPLDTELRFLNAYLAIMAARFGDGLVAELRVAPDVGSALVPHLILQPLVENAIQHCTKEPGRPGRVDVSVTGAAGRLTLAIEDNGAGLTGPSQAALAAGVGLSNTAGRLEALYGEDHRLVLDRGREGGLRVQIDLPWRLSEQPVAVS